jgi:hypothetical protein
MTRSAEAAVIYVSYGGRRVNAGFVTEVTPTFVSMSGRRRVNASSAEARLQPAVKCTLLTD